MSYLDSTEKIIIALLLGLIIGCLVGYAGTQGYFINHYNFQPVGGN